MVHSDLFVFDNDIPSVRIILSVGSLNTKNLLYKQNYTLMHIFSNYVSIHLIKVHFAVKYFRECM